MGEQARRIDRVQAVLMAGSAATTVAYWVDYFTGGHVRTSQEPAYLAFQNAFPVADAYMAVCLAVGARHLWVGDVRAVPVGIAAGSALIFLGAMDTTWNLEHRAYRKRSTEMTVETAINAMSLVFGPLTIMRLWRRRNSLT